MWVLIGIGQAWVQRLAWRQCPYTTKSCYSPETDNPGCAGFSRSDIGQNTTLVIGMDIRKN